MSNVVRYMENPKNYITFNGKDFRDFKVYCNGTDTYTVPQHEYETVQIPGRNGDFKRDLGRFQQVTVPYDCWIATNFDTNIKALREYLMSVNGYATLVDTYHPNTYRKAIFEGPIEVKPAIGLSFGSFTLNFNCKPERWLTSGSTEITISSGDSVNNPTNFDAKPLIKLIGSGTIACGPSSGTYPMPEVYRITVSPTIAGEYTIDTDRLMAYDSNGTNVNSHITPTNRNKWLVLRPGSSNNVINFTGFTSVKIIPRWWTI